MVLPGRPPGQPFSCCSEQTRPPASSQQYINTIHHGEKANYWVGSRITVFTREKSTGSHEGGLDDLDLLDPIELSLVHQLVKLGDDVVEYVQRLCRVLVSEEGSELRQAEHNF